MRHSVLAIAAAFLAAHSLSAQSPEPSGRTAADAAFERAAALVRDGHGDAGRQIVDSIFVRTRTGTPEHAEALYWRAALAMDTQQAEGDYRRLVVEYPVTRRVDRALLALAQLELARNDRERALAHLQRIEREHPNGDARPTAAFWTARIRFDMNDAPRACAALDDALRLAPAGDVELRNQVEFLASRCEGIDRVVGRQASGVGRNQTAVGVRESGVGGSPEAGGSGIREAKIDSAAVPPARTPPSVPQSGVAPDARRPTPIAFSVQVAAYDTRAEADALVQRLARRNVVARVSGTAKPFRVRTGNYATRAAANAALADLRTRGIHGFIVDEQAAATP